MILTDNDMIWLILIIATLISVIAWLSSKIHEYRCLLFEATKNPIFSNVEFVVPDDAPPLPPDIEYKITRRLCERHNISGSKAKTLDDLVAELKCDNMELMARLKNTDQ